jgi:FkbM family methyltransferase
VSIHAHQIRATASRAGALLVKNPALFCRVVAAKLNTARPLPSVPLRRKIGDVEIEFDDPHYRGTAPMFYGSYALPLVSAMRRCLRAGDAFIDIGANIGYVSAIAADIVGTSGKVHAFEPVRRYFERLAELARMNSAYSIVANRCAAGDVHGTSSISVTREPGQNTMVPGYKNGAEVDSVEQIQVVRLDDYCAEHHLDRVAMIKIDAEGFELPILKGLSRYQERTANPPVIACEIAPKAYALLDETIDDLDLLMARYGYRCVDILDGKTPIVLSELRDVQDVLFLPR